MSRSVEVLDSNRAAFFVGVVNCDKGLATGEYLSHRSRSAISIDVCGARDTSKVLFMSSCTGGIHRHDDHKKGCNLLLCMYVRVWPKLPPHEHMINPALLLILLIALLHLLQLSCKKCVGICRSRCVTAVHTSSWREFSRSASAFSFAILISRLLAASATALAASMGMFIAPQPPCNLCGGPLYPVQPKERVGLRAAVKPRERRREGNSNLLRIYTRVGANTACRQPAPITPHISGICLLPAALGLLASGFWLLPAQHATYHHVPQPIKSCT